MGASVGKKGFVSEINVTPFVDVMLVLLIIFMVTAPMMDQGLDVDLPETKQVDALPSDAEHLTLTVRKDGAIMLEGYSVPLEELESRLAVLAGAVPYGVVVDVMGRIKAAGIDKLGVLALPAGNESASGQTGESAASR